MQDLCSNFKETFMKIMKAKKMTNIINLIMAETERDRDREHYRCRVSDPRCGCCSTRSTSRCMMTAVSEISLH